MSNNLEITYELPIKQSIQGNHLEYLYYRMSLVRFIPKFLTVNRVAWSISADSRVFEHF